MEPVSCSAIAAERTNHIVRPARSLHVRGNNLDVESLVRPLSKLRDIISSVNILVLGDLHPLRHHICQQIRLRTEIRVHQIRRRVHAFKARDDLERITLVNEELLTLGRVVHLLGVFADEGVEKRVESLVVSPLGTENPAETLGFLTTGSKVRGNLDEAGRFGEIDRGVSNFRQKESVHRGVMLEVLQHAESFLLGRSAVDKGFLELPGVGLEGVDVIRKDDDLVAARLVVVNEVLANLELFRVHDAEQTPFSETRTN